MSTGAAKQNIIDRPLSKGRAEVSLSAFSFLFSEIVQYSQGRVQNISDLEKKLEDLGHGVGLRVLELLCSREKGSRRETRLINILQFIASTVWKSLFGKGADALERSTDNEDEYMIHDSAPLTNQFMSVPPNLGQLNCAAYTAGIIRGVLDGAEFPSRVSAHHVGEGGAQLKTVFLIKFSEDVMQREAKMG